MTDKYYFVKAFSSDKDVKNNNKTPNGTTVQSSS